VAGLESLLGAGSKSTMNSVQQLILSLLAILTASGVLAVFLGSPALSALKRQSSALPS